MKKVSNLPEGVTYLFSPHKLGYPSESINNSVDKPSPRSQLTKSLITQAQPTNIDSCYTSS